jgi:dihydroorotase
MEKFLIKGIWIVNEGRIQAGDVLIANGRIERIAGSITVSGNVTEINGEGRFLLPGAIDDQVHFANPALRTKPPSTPKARPPWPVA